MTILSKRLKELRLKNNLKIVEMAKIAGVSAKTIKNWEETKTQMRLAKPLKNICDYFDISMDFMLGRVDEDFNKFNK